LEEAVVELKIVERASDNTIGRTLRRGKQSENRTSTRMRKCRRIGDVRRA
jgi:hypothetical protein